MTEEFKKLRDPFNFPSGEARLTEDQAIQIIENPKKYFDGKTMAERILTLSQISVLYHESEKLREFVAKKTENT